MVLEKVFAKLHGDFCRIIGGNCHETFRDLTGAPSFLTLTEEKEIDVLWAEVYDADQKNFIICAGIDGASEGDNQELKDMGLVSGHAYGVIAAAEVTDSKGKKARIVNVRNPWGSFEWNKDWSDNSPLWTPQAKRQVNFVSNDNDGLFWMSIEDFKEYFSCIYTCKYKDDFQFSYEKLDPARGKGEYILRMTVHKSGDYTIAVSQKDDRCFSFSSDYEYGSCNILLAQEDNKGNI